MIRLKADNARRCVLIYIDSSKIPVLGHTISKFLQAISHKVKPYRPEPGEILGDFEVLFVRVPQSKTIEETLLLQERVILNFLQDLRRDLDGVDLSDIQVLVCADPHEAPSS